MITKDIIKKRARSKRQEKQTLWIWKMTLGVDFVDVSSV